jgi:hypothetical protein
MTQSYENQPICTCEADGIPGGCGHDLGCPVRRLMIAEVLNSEGRPTGIRRDDALSMLDFLARVENSTEIMKLAGPSRDPWVAIGKFLDLFDSPRNIDELWVWNKFRWLFGRGNSVASDTWKADDTLDALLAATIKLRDLSTQWHDRGRLRWLARRKLAAAIDVAQVHLFTILGTLLVNRDAWPELAAFAQWKG